MLDEPTVGCGPAEPQGDPRGGRDPGDEGKSVLYTTHYMEEAQRLCNRVGIIDEGS